MPFVQTSEKRELRKVTKNKTNQHTADMFCKPHVAFSAQESKKQGYFTAKVWNASEKRRNFALANEKTVHNCAALHGSLAQLNRASDYGSEGYRFESCRSHQPKPHDGINNPGYIKYPGFFVISKPATPNTAPKSIGHACFPAYRFLQTIRRKKLLYKKSHDRK